MRMGLIGIGFMGRGHLDQYVQLKKEHSDIELVAIADIDPDKFKGIFVKDHEEFNENKYDFSEYHCYTDAKEMLEKENLDGVDIVLPTYLHAEYAIMAMEAGVNVLCEKPMALNLADCDRMIEASERTGKKLMIAQVLRFWRAYEILKEFVDNGKLGKPVFFDMFRGGGIPQWSYMSWEKDEALSGGCIMDQHIHDVDMLNWLFGKPEAISCMGRNVIPGAGFDAVSTHYRYEGMIAHTADDWAMFSKDMPFSMWYRANFEKGTVVLQDGITKVYPVDGDCYVADDGSGPNGYYREICHFAHEVCRGKSDKRVALDHIRQTIAMVEAEHRSASRLGEWVTVEI